MQVGVGGVVAAAEKGRDAISNMQTVHKALHTSAFTGIDTSTITVLHHSTRTEAAPHTLECAEGTLVLTSGRAGRATVLEDFTVGTSWGGGHGRGCGRGWCSGCN